jgi:hypothetical protein
VPVVTVGDIWALTDKVQVGDGCDHVIILPQANGSVKPTGLIW